MKTSELTGLALDWAVAKCEGWSNYDHGDPCEKAGFFCLNGDYSFALYLSSYSPSTDWAQGGQIIDKADILIGKQGDGDRHFAVVIDPVLLNTQHHALGETKLIAAMRAYVMSVLGNDIEIPKELQ